jgi:ankyrin repeat protein
MKQLNLIFFILKLYLGIVDSPECVDLLLHHGAKVNAQDLKNNTAAMVACFFNKPRILTNLIRAGADLTVRNNEGIKFKGISFLNAFFFSRQRCT